MKYITNKILAFILSAVFLLTTSPLNVFAGLSFYKPEYGKGTYSEPADYIKIHKKVFQGKGATVPTAKLAITNKDTGIQLMETINDEDEEEDVVVNNVAIGTTVKIDNLSTPGSGTAIDQVEFQVTKGGNMVTAITGKPALLNNYELKLTEPGYYNFYLCVRNNTAKEKTDGWGNWSYNGFHRSIGINNGKNDKKETTGTPEVAGGDDFWGYWYFTKIVLQVVEKPIADQDYSSLIVRTGTENQTDGKPIANVQNEAVVEYRITGSDENTGTAEVELEIKNAKNIKVEGLLDTKITEGKITGKLDMSDAYAYGELQGASEYITYPEVDMDP